VECEIRVMDNTVSRVHATLKFAENRFLIEDGNSKFGTLIQVREPLKLIPLKPACIQIGRTVFTILVRDPLARPPDPEEIARETVGEQNEKKKHESNYTLLDSVLNDAHPSNINQDIMNEAQVYNL